MDSVAGSDQNFQGNDQYCVNVNTEDEWKNSLQFQANLPKKESDGHRIRQRQKQIEYGKNTLGYKSYIEIVPREQRKKNDPWTPDVKQICSKRSWDGQVKKWRRLLHHYDPPNHNHTPQNHDTIESKNATSTELLQLYQQWLANNP
ncbi:hypothetical protein SUGI_1037500 [Cryptomeria japonica]|nr:hypothetical protein SUGI_1037500 [Cryptomeria japonica]